MDTQWTFVVVRTHLFDMATARFSPVSPYKKDLPLHPSDFKKLSFDIFAPKDLYAGKTPLMKRVGLVLFGTGRQGNVHLENIIGNPRLELRYIVEEDISKWEKVKEKWNLSGDTHFIKANQAEEALSDPSVHACMVVTPMATHQQLILQGLKAGKHVFCEKPMAETTEDVRECYEVAKSVGKSLFCAFNRRFDSSFRDAYNKVRAGEIGQVQQIQVMSRDSPLPPIAYLATSGGIFHDCSIHDIDILTWILGEFPSEVWVNGNAMFPEIQEIGDLDNVIINLKFPSGTIGTISNCRYAAFGHDQRLEVYGRDGLLSVGNDRPNRNTVSKWNGSLTTPILQTTPSRYPEAYKAELDHFLDIVQGYDKPIVTGEMTAGVQKICDACKESAKTGEKVILTWSDSQIPD